MGRKKTNATKFTYYLTDGKEITFITTDLEDKMCLVSSYERRIKHLKQHVGDMNKIQHCAPKQERIYI